MTSLEWIAVALGLANIVLLTYRSIWNYPFGIVMVSLYGLIFFEQKLYSDALLQIFFLALNVYGWLNWRAAREDGGIPVRWLPKRTRILCLAGLVIATLIWGSLMHRFTDAAYPHWDAAVAMCSILAQWLLARRYIDNWLGWIMVDLLAIPLYWAKGLQLTAGLYVVFLILSFTGLLSWMRSIAPKETVRS